MKKLLLLLLFLFIPTLGSAQTNTFCASNLACTVTGVWGFSQPITATFTFTNHNALYWAGPGATPTIDQAIASCGANPCVVEISPLYTGPESASLFTNSLGYKTFTGGNNVTVKDMRANSNVSPTLAPIYGILYGGRLAGQLNREGVSYYASSPADSSTGITSFNWFTGTAPSNGGLQAGSINAMIIHDAVTIGSSLSEFNGTDSEMHADATSADNPLLNISSYGGGVLFSRSNAAQNVLQANTFRSKTCSNSGAPAQFFYCYGFRGDNQTGGTYRNYSFSSQGNFLFEGGTQIWAEDYGTGCTIANSPTGATESGQTVTITTTAPCAAAVIGAHFNISGVGVAGYNGDAILLSGSGGTTFTYFAPGTSGLAASGSGTALPHTPRVTTSFGVGSNDTITYQPLLDANGWVWQTQAASQLFKITNAAVLFNVSLVPASAGLANLGLASLPFSQLVLGNVANQTYTFNPLAAAGNRTINIPDFGANGPTTQNYPGITILTSQYTNSTTGFTTVTGGNTLQFPVLANTTYTATCHLYYQAVATGGLNIQFIGPAAPTTIIYGLNEPVAANAVAGDSVATAFATSLGSAVTTAATNFDAIVSLSLINGANAGTVVLQAKSSAAVQLQIQAGSFCRIQ